MKRIYLAGPIAGCSDAECKDWREYAKQWLYQRQAEGVDPLRRDYRLADEQQHWPYREIVELDKYDIRGCDAVLVHWTRMSIGTAMEVLFAWENKKPVIVAIDTKTVQLSPWLLYHATELVPDLQSALDWLKKHILET